MAIGKHKDDYTFYKRYEGEEELIFSTEEESLHIWDGYIEDIFGNPLPTQTVQDGLSRDYNELTGPYTEDCIIYPVDAESYLKDAKQYENRAFNYPESKNVLKTLIKWLEQHQTKAITVRLY